VVDEEQLFKQIGSLGRCHRVDGARIVWSPVTALVGGHLDPIVEFFAECSAKALEET
jgi:hypothetical protein